MTRSFRDVVPRLPLIFFACAAIGAGCMPASRIRHDNNSAEKDAKALQEARSDQNLTTDRRLVLMEAERWLGTPYVWGGSSRNGADCSGFVQRVFASADVTLPRTSREQADAGASIPIERASPGDLLFFNTMGEGVSHVGIALGDGRFVHASSSRGVVVSSLGEDYYRERVLFARRVLRR